MREFSRPFWVEPAPNAGMMDSDEILIAKEKGRFGAALIYRENAEKRAEGERIFGVDYMKNRYPEAYANSKRPFLDHLKFWW